MSECDCSLILPYRHICSLRGCRTLRLLYDGHCVVQSIGCYPGKLACGIGFLTLNRSFRKCPTKKVVVLIISVFYQLFQRTLKTCHFSLGDCWIDMPIARLITDAKMTLKRTCLIFNGSIIPRKSVEIEH